MSEAQRLPPAPRAKGSAALQVQGHGDQHGLRGHGHQAQPVQEAPQGPHLGPAGWGHAFPRQGP